MKLKTLKVAGFRGFNEMREFVFNDRITLLSASNSHGKTSLSEALEFLISGQTSKVRAAYSKDEFRHSYRNRHFPSEQKAFIEAEFVDPDKPVVLRVELDSAENIRRYYNAEEVGIWPFLDQMLNAAEPFVLQHALKYLLLVTPDERFQGFARLLGLDSIDTLHRVIISLCTKPEAKIPAETTALLTSYNNLLQRLSGYIGLAKVLKEFKKGKIGIKSAYATLEKRTEELVGKKVSGEQCLAALIKAKNEATAKVFSGSVSLTDLTEKESAQFEQAKIEISNSISKEFISKFASLAVDGAVHRLQDEANFYELGMSFLDKEPHVCPLCGQEITEELRAHLLGRHAELTARVKEAGSPGQIAKEIQTDMKNLGLALQNHSRLTKSKSSGLLSAALQSDKLTTLFGDTFKNNYHDVLGALEEIKKSITIIDAKIKDIETRIASIEESLKSNTEDSRTVEELGKEIIGYLSAVKEYELLIQNHKERLANANAVLQKSIETVARTGELAIAIELFQEKRQITKGNKVADLLAGLKSLKKEVEQAVAEAMTEAIAGDFSGSVMDWYKQIRTTGDPDIHFSGFEMEKTKTGEFKSRRLGIKAKSYGVELASAVSSLSESKLNALGLCVSIACALRSPGPWGFLVLDDPIQSWDDEHEEQFIGVIRNLVESGKQLILLSHKKDWIDRVCAGCRTLNGIKYEITGYTREGPHVKEIEWAALDQRLREVDGIIKDPRADSVRLQQGEEEIRIAICQLAAEVSRRSGKEKSAHSLNATEVRKILTEAGIKTVLVDKIYAAFEVTDDAHHAPKKYSPCRERLQQYLNHAHELRQITKNNGT